MIRASRRAELYRDLAIAVAAPAAAVLLAELIHTGLGVSRFGLLFLAAVTVAASIRGSRAAVFSAIVGVAAYKLFLDLRTTEHTTAIEDVLNLAVFLVVALVTGTLAGRLHDEAAKARRHAENTDLLYSTSRTLSDVGDGTDFWAALARAVAVGTGSSCIALNAEGDIEGRASGSGDVIQPRAEASAIESGRRALAGTHAEASASNSSWRTKTIQYDRGTAGVLVWEVQEETEQSDEFTDLVVELAAASLTRKQARDEKVSRQAAEEASRLREALLSSISHDFRSPLAAIIGSATSLLEYGDKFEEPVRRDLLANIRDEGEKLNQFVANLLAMTQVQAGVVRASNEPIILGEVVQAVVERLTLHRGEIPKVLVDADCVVSADRLLLEQALYNVLDNAAKYANTPGGLEITCVEDGPRSCIRISDHGPGLPEEDHEGIFTTFHFSRKTGHSKGTGLGLSITKGFIEAMGGTITASHRSDGQPGLEIAVSLPRSKS